MFRTFQYTLKEYEVSLKSLPSGSLEANSESKTMPFVKLLSSSFSKLVSKSKGVIQATVRSTSPKAEELDGTDNDVRGLGGSDELLGVLSDLKTKKEIKRHEYDICATSIMETNFDSKEFTFLIACSGGISDLGSSLIGGPLMVAFEEH